MGCYYQILKVNTAHSWNGNKRSHLRTNPSKKCTALPKHEEEHFDQRECTRYCLLRKVKTGRRYIDSPWYAPAKRENREIKTRGNDGKRIFNGNEEKISGWR